MHDDGAEEQKNKEKEDEDETEEISQKVTKQAPQLLCDVDKKAIRIDLSLINLG